MTGDLDLLVEFAVVAGSLAGGVRPEFVSAKSSLGARQVGMLASARCIPSRNPRWTPEDDRYLADHLGRLSEDELAHILGRTVCATHLRWERDLRLTAPSKAATLMTGEQVAQGLDMDGHAVAKLIARGILPMRALPFSRGRVIHVVERVALLRWMIRPENWVYFATERVGTRSLKQARRRNAQVYDAAWWAKAGRIVLLARARWDDEWWPIGRVARHHRVDIRVVNRAIHLGRLPAVDWGNWWIKRSDATDPRLHFVTGNGRPGHPRTSQWSAAADAFAVLARAVGHTCDEIGRMMDRDGEGVRQHFAFLFRSGQIPAIIRRHGLAVRYRLGTYTLAADWRACRRRFPGLERRVTALERKGNLTRVEGQQLARIRRCVSLAPKR